MGGGHPDILQIILALSLYWKRSKPKASRQRKHNRSTTSFRNRKIRFNNTFSRKIRETTQTPKIQDLRSPYFREKLGVERVQIQDARAELARRDRILAALPLARRSRADRRRRWLGKKLPGSVQAPMRIPEHSRVILHSIQSRKNKEIAKISAWKAIQSYISRSWEEIEGSITGRAALEGWRCWRPADWSHLLVEEESRKLSEYWRWWWAVPADRCICLPTAFMS